MLLRSLRQNEINMKYIILFSLLVALQISFLSLGGSPFPQIDGRKIANFGKDKECPNHNMWMTSCKLVYPLVCPGDFTI